MKIFQRKMSTNIITKSAVLCHTLHGYKAKLFISDIFFSIMIPAESKFTCEDAIYCRYLVELLATAQSVT